MSTARIPDGTPLGLVCLYFGDPCECQWCGGCTKAEGGPFEGDPRYCSEDCFAEASERARKAAEYVATNWCLKCGYDNHEHALECPALEQIPEPSPAAPGTLL